MWTSVVRVWVWDIGGLQALVGSFWGVTCNEKCVVLGLYRSHLGFEFRVEGLEFRVEGVCEDMGFRGART